MWVNKLQLQLHTKRTWARKGKSMIHSMYDAYRVAFVSSTKKERNKRRNQTYEQSTNINIVHIYCNLQLHDVREVI